MNGVLMNRRRITTCALSLLLATAFLLPTGAAASPPRAPESNSLSAIAQMLPATTTMFVTADLHPTGTAGSNLAAIEKAFTGQPGWAAAVQALMGTSKGSTTGATSCLKGQGTAVTGLMKAVKSVSLAVVGTGSSAVYAHAAVHGKSPNHKGVATKGSKKTGKPAKHKAKKGKKGSKGTATGGQTASGSTPKAGTTGSSSPALSPELRANAVILATVDLQQSLLGLLSGGSITLKGSTTYGGVTIATLALPTCSSSTATAPQTAELAVFKEEVLLAFALGPIERVIDAASGAVPALSSNGSFADLVSRLPANPIAAYYVTPKGLQQLLAAVPSATSTSQGSMTPTPPAVDLSGAQPVAGGVYAEAGGIRLLSFSPRSTTTPTVTAPAGQLASQLPGTVLAFGSIQGLGAIMAAASKAGALGGAATTGLAPILADLTANLSGETDLVLFSPIGTLNLTGNPAQSRLPLALLWQVGDERAAATHLQDLAAKLLPGVTFNAATASDGTAYHVASTGAGYAVRKGWAILSLDIVGTLNALIAAPAGTLTSLPAYSQAIPAGATPTSVFYVNVHALRLQLEAALLPGLTAQQRQQYLTTIQPLLAPIQSMEGSTATTADGKSEVSSVFVSIAPPS